MNPPKKVSLSSRTRFGERHAQPFAGPKVRGADVLDHTDASVLYNHTVAHRVLMGRRERAMVRSKYINSIGSTETDHSRISAALIPPALRNHYIHNGKRGMRNG